MRYSHIVFDIDNTLIDTTAAVLHSLQKALREVTGEHREVGKLAPVLGIPGLQAFEMLGIQSPELIFRIYPLWEKYMNSYQHTAYVYEGIRPLLKYLKNEGYGLGIITSKTASQYESTFVPFGIAGYFQCTVTADDTVHHKPGPEPMNAYMWMNDVRPSQVLYVGDSVYDMECALAAGTDSALALWGCHDPEGIPSTYRFAAPGDMEQWFQDGCPA
ncbi:HAD family hydrolase [Clostridiales bacterium TF09-2AC]|nr:HAD family hydrolase [Clostridiales bacterium TF09-2AC]